MQYIKKKIMIVIAIIFFSVAYYLISPLFIIKESNDILPMVNYVMGSPMGTKVGSVVEILSGELVPSAHDVSGRVAVYDDNGRKILRFENLETVNGPDLFIYLATDVNSDDFVNLGKIKATKGNVNYEILNDVDLEKYDTVLIWCDAFNVLFSYAELKK
ncbi:MAG: DM13 domain-containing protein [Nanoarchaeota archaeon]